MFRQPLCPSSGAREYYTSGCCLSYLVLWFSSCRYGVELMMGIMVPETCWASNKICNKNSSVASSWHFISTQCCMHFRRTTQTQPISFELCLVAFPQSVLPQSWCIHFRPWCARATGTIVVIDVSPTILSPCVTSWHTAPCHFLTYCDMSLPDIQGVFKKKDQTFANPTNSLSTCSVQRM